MLRTIGVKSFEELLTPMPEAFRLARPLDIPGPESEYEIARWMESLAARNRHGGNTRVFLGAGSYDHIIPAAVDHLSFRSEFYTCYTPYQPEVAQATLAAIFEFQTMMSELTGMDLANASLYDGASAVAEAALLSASVTGRSRIVVAGPMHPNYVQVLETFAHGQNIEVILEPGHTGGLDEAALLPHIDERTAAVIVQTPNFFGGVDDPRTVFAAARAAGAHSICVFEPHALALLATPGELGADIAVGEGLSLGTPPSVGGPALGLFACKQEFVRYLPGRLVGETVDRDGKQAFVLTRQTREQHIRREKATSNICTNQGLLALRATIYMALLGPDGMTEVARQCMERAHYAAERLTALDGFRLHNPGPFFHEFVLECPVPAGELAHRCLADGVIPGLDLGRFPERWGPKQKNLLHVCVTEKNLREDIDALAASMKRAVAEVARV